MTSPFTSARDKLRRGDQHLDSLREDFGRLQRPESERAALNFESRGETVQMGQGLWIISTHTVRVSDVLRLGDDFSLIYGDAIHNYRVALDHLTWSLVGMFTKGLRESAARKVQFPMHNSAADFEAWKERRTPGVPDRPHRALLKRYQPYRRGSGPQAIRLVRWFADRDKHRKITPSIVAPQGVRVEVHASPEVRLLGMKELLVGPAEL